MRGLWKLEPGCEIAGRVVDAEGRPCPARTVRLDEGLAWACTDVEGRFRIRGLPPRPLWVQVENRRDTLHRDVAPDTKDLVIVLPAK